MVHRWLTSGAFPDHLLAGVGADRSFIMDMVYGVVRYKAAVEWILNRYARRSPEPRVQALMLVGLYQLLYMDDVEDHAAIHETVEAAREMAGDSPVGFVNAILRRAQRQRDALREALNRQPMSIRLSHPERLTDRWIQRYGEEHATRLCEWNNRPAETVLRVNRSRTSMEAFVRALRDGGIDVQPHPFDSGRFLILPHGQEITGLPGFKQGWFTVQDPSTIVAVDLLDPQPGERILDACSAPGGKLLAIADRMDGKADLVASDSEAGRLDMLKQNLARCGWDRVRVQRADFTAARIPRALCAPPPDAVLLDVPCTNTGVIRRRPDARWRFQLKRLRQLTRVQEKMLDQAARLVRSGGRIVYSTCSLEPEENIELLAGWLGKHPGFALEKETHLFPPDTGTDGVYAARLRKSAR